MIGRISVYSEERGQDNKGPPDCAPWVMLKELRVSGSRRGDLPVIIDHYLQGWVKPVAWFPEPRTCKNEWNPWADRFQFSPRKSCLIVRAVNR